MGHVQGTVCRDFSSRLFLLGLCLLYNQHNLIVSCGILLFSRDTEYIPLSKCCTVWSQILALWAYLQKDQVPPHAELLHLPPLECLQHVKELKNLEDFGTHRYLCSQSQLGLRFHFQKAGTDTSQPLTDVQRQENCAFTGTACTQTALT